MSDEINQYRDRFLETASMTIVAADQSLTTRVDAPSTQFIEINSMSLDGVNRVFKADNRLYPTAVLAELSALVRRVRATSPDSALAAVANAKIGRIIALDGGASRLE
jgi:predicted ATP-dependent serine protease